MKTTIRFTLLVCLAAFLEFGCGKTENDVPVDSEIPVKVAELIKTDQTREIKTSGQFTTDDETILSFKTGGVVRSIYADEGDLIKRGQVLAVLDLTEINAQVSQAKIAYNKALRDYNRLKNLYYDSVATLSDFEDSKSGLDAAIKQLEIAEYNLDYSEIRALDDGFVLKKFINEGRIVAPGEPIYLTNGAGSGNWLLKVSVSDKDWADISTDDKALIKTDAYPGKEIAAFVYRKSQGVDLMTGTLSVDLKIQDNADFKIASGMFANAEIYLTRKSSLWSIPFEAVLDGDANTGMVFTTNDLKSVTKNKIKIAYLKSGSVFVSEGLENVKYVIVTGSAYLNKDSKIKVIN